MPSASETIMKQLFNQPTLAGIFGLVVLAAACSTPIAMAQDDQASLQLLTDTMKTIDDPDVLHALLQGTLRGLEGRRDVLAPKDWPALARRLQKSEDAKVRDLSNQLSQIFGDEQAVQRALQIVRDSQAPAKERGRQLTILLDQKNRDASDYLRNLLDHPELQLLAVRGYSAVENQDAPALLLQRFPDMSDDLQQAVIETLATRRSYAQALLAAVESKIVSRDQVPTHVARSLDHLLGERFVQIFGEPPALSHDREEQIAEWKRKLTPEILDRADASQGRLVFQKTCAACHQLYGEGGQIGPDLTGSNRANLDYLLLNSIDPSFDVPAAYRMTTIATVDGRVVNGVIAEEDTTRVILKTVEQPRLVIAKSDIDERVISDKSMMPEGQLDQLKPQQVFDLISYLRTTEQVELAQ